jgi:CRISPR-associated endonuclease Csn1
VFKKHSRVKVDQVREYLKSLNHTNTAFRGTQKDNEFASSLKSYCDFSRILGYAFDSYEDYEMVEELILWVTVFEDKKILERKIRQKYGSEGSKVLNSKQIQQISRLRYTGWSNLSKEFLTELRVDYNGRNLSIMGALRDCGKVHPMNLMQILSEKEFGFQELLDEKNKDYLDAHQDFLLADIPGSPAIKRGIQQALAVVEEIVKLAGKPSRRIIVEMAREDVGKGKGKRTTSRYKRLEELYKNLQNDILLEDSERLSGELKDKEERLDDDSLFLYFLQRGKCLYCGKSLEIENLARYHIDHIVPQSMIKDDSLDNRVLVCDHCNEAKKERYPLPSEMRTPAHKNRWREFKEAGLISAKKFNKLIQIEGDDKRLDHMAQGFINRQLV